MEWIKASERLPNKDRNFYTRIRGKNKSCGHFHKGASSVGYSEIGGQFYTEEMEHIEWLDDEVEVNDQKQYFEVLIPSVKYPHKLVGLAREPSYMKALQFAIKHLGSDILGNINVIKKCKTHAYTGKNLV